MPRALVRPWRYPVEPAAAASKSYLTRLTDGHPLKNKETNWENEMSIRVPCFLIGTFFVLMIAGFVELGLLTYRRRDQSMPGSFLGDKTANTSRGAVKRKLIAVVASLVSVIAISPATAGVIFDSITAPFTTFNGNQAGIFLQDQSGTSTAGLAVRFSRNWLLSLLLSGSG
jgi:hypothetical protein